MGCEFALNGYCLYADLTGYIPSDCEDGKCCHMSKNCDCYHDDEFSELGIVEIKGKEGVEKCLKEVFGKKVDLPSWLDVTLIM